MPKSNTGIETSADSSHHDLIASGGPVAPYRGRFAPSPSGPLHFGSMLAAVGSWLDARAAGGQWLVRMEDLDPPRESAGAAADILRTLEAFDLPWDGEVIYQSTRLDAYEAALAQLAEDGWAYPCICSRKDIETANERRGRPGERAYPGTCRALAPGKAANTRVVRLRTAAAPIGIVDRLQGEYFQRLEPEVGDVVVRRREGYIAYQLAVVIDDAAQGITDVVRGMDLLDSTPRQRWLQKLLSFPAPRYMHLPIIVQPDGQKLSKQTGAAAVDKRDASTVSWHLLDCLGQLPPAQLRGAPPRELWDWGAANWAPQKLTGVRSITRC